MKLEKIIKTLQPISVTGTGDPEIKGIAVDSRRVREGFLFIAISGAKYDGTSFIEDALSRGAAAVVSEKKERVSAKATGIQVQDIRLATSMIAAAFNNYPSQHLDVFGITGTNGKTTTAFMIRDILKAAGKKPGMIGTVQYEIGDRTIPAERTTPGPVELQGLLRQMAEISCDSVVMEVSSHAIDQKRVSNIEFDTGLFTNLTQDHLDYHKDMEQYFQAKARFFIDLSRSGKQARAVINADDSYGARLLAMPEINVEKISFGENPEAVVRVTNLKIETTGSIIDLRSPWGNAVIKLRMPGRFNASNAVGAFAACAGAGIDTKVISKALSSIISVPGRLEHITAPDGFDVFVDYAHTDDAMKNVLLTLRELTFGKLIIVFGCGGDRDKTKRPRMGKTAEELADRVIITSDNPRNEDPDAIIADIIAGCEQRDKITVLPDRHEAIRTALSNAGPGDVVLIAGKGHENYQDFGNRVAPFDDKHVALEYISNSNNPTNK